MSVVKAKQAGKQYSEKEIFWRNMIFLHQMGGKDTRDFCQEQSITMREFYYWRSKLVAKDRKQKSFQAATVDVLPSDQDAGQLSKSPFVPLHLMPDKVVCKKEVEHSLDILTPAGYRISVGADIELLAKVINALEGQQQC
jgi:hypothetical protein